MTTLPWSSRRSRSWRIRKKDVSDGDLEAIVSQHMVRTPEMYKLVRVQVVTGNDSVPTATVQLRTEDEVLEDAAIGDGPVDAVVRAISRITGVEARLTEYTLQAITPGVEAQGEGELAYRVGGAHLYRPRDEHRYCGGERGGLPQRRE